MKILYIILMFLVFNGVKIFSQNGYKEYTWGMSYTEVINICSDISLVRDTYGMGIIVPNETSVIVDYLQKNVIRNIELVNIFDTQIIQNLDKLELYFSQNNKLLFSFIRGKLRAIQIFDLNGLIYQDFVNVYGNPFNSERWGDEIDSVFYNDNNKFILLVRFKSRVGKNYYVAKLCYIDRIWYMEKGKEEFERIKKLEEQWRRERDQKVKDILD